MEVVIGDDMGYKEAYVVWWAPQQRRAPTMIDHLNELEEENAKVDDQEEIEIDVDPTRQIGQIRGKVID